MHYLGSNIFKLMQKVAKKRYFYGENKRNAFKHLTLQILTFSLFLGFAKPYDLYAINNIKKTKIGFFSQANFWLCFLSRRHNQPVLLYLTLKIVLLTRLVTWTSTKCNFAFCTEGHVLYFHHFFPWVLLI